MEPIKRVSSDKEMEVLDMTGDRVISTAIERMRQALKEKDTKAFELARAEVEELFRTYGYAE